MDIRKRLFHAEIKASERKADTENHIQGVIHETS